LNITLMLENKLKAKDRDILDSEEFGLPKERKYPLIDEEHIRQAIRFFKYCKPTQKLELSNNINRKAKIYRMEMNLSKTNPFYKYADKSILKESISMDDLIYDIELPEGILELSLKNDYLKKMLNELYNFLPSSLEELFIFEKKIYESYYIPFVHYFLLNNLNKIETPVKYLLKAINEYMYKIIYKRGFEHILYIDGANYLLSSEINIFIDSFKLQINMVNDICYMIDSENTEDDNNKYLSMLMNNVKHSIGLDCLRALSVNNNLLKDTTKTKIETLSNLLDIFIKSFIKEFSSVYGAYSKVEINARFNYNDYLDVDLNNSIRYLEKKSNELKDLTRISLTKTKLLLGINFFDETNSFFLQDISINNSVIYDILDFLSGSLNPDFIKSYDKNYTLKLESVDLIFLNKLKEFYSGIYTASDRNDEIIYYGIGSDRLYLLGKNTSNIDEFILIKLYENGEELNIIPLVDKTGIHSLKRLNPINMKIIYRQKPKYFNDILTEGISIDKEGNIKISFKPTKSYMDEYSENHALLIENFKSKNFEAMKHNLAFLFALINSIERDVIYNKKVNDENILVDAKKARAFAINDFKTYLKEIEKNEKRFDFTKYYHDGEYDSVIYNIDKNSILGVKKLFSLIMMG